MKYLFIVNSNLSKKTAWFWTKNKKKINDYFSSFESWIPTSKFIKLPFDINKFETIVLVGDDSFFSCFINSVFYELAPSKHQTCIAFIPDHKSAVVTKSLGIPAKFSKQCELILKKQSVFLDLIRCHYLDIKGIPRSQFIINDALVGISPIKLPFLLKSVAEVTKVLPFLPNSKKNKHIKLYSGGTKIFDGSYAFSTVMLGQKLIDGPSIPGRNKIRCNLSNFDYYQINAAPRQGFETQFAYFHQSNTDSGTKYLISGSFDELTIKGEGQANSVIVDGTYLGRLPATFSFLPKAVRVIAPLLTVRVSQPWQKKVPAAGFPKPIGSRNSFRNKDKK